MPNLTRDQILSFKPQLREVPVPEWGGSVWIRPLTMAEQGKLTDAAKKFDKSPTGEQARNVLLRAFLWAVCDQEGNQLFDGKDDVDALMNQPSSPLFRVNDAIYEYSGLTREAREELAKNLQAALSGESGSD